MKKYARLQWYSQPINNPENVLDKRQLEELLLLRGYNISLNNKLKGGKMSNVYEGYLDNEKVVLKQYLDINPKSSFHFNIGRDISQTEYYVLNKLKGSTIPIPKVIKYFDDIPLLLMDDLRKDNYSLMIHSILEGSLNETSANKIGIKLGELTELSKKWKSFRTTQSSYQNFYDSGLEMNVLFPNHTYYNDLKTEFTQSNQGWIWIDGTPKNMFINNEGNVSFIDFGLSCFADIQHTLPTFIAHIIIYGIADYIPINFSISYSQDCIDSYKEQSQIDELKFCKYFAMEILHRSFGKRIYGIEKLNHKFNLIKIGMTIFEKNISKIELCFELIEQIYRK